MVHARFLVVLLVVAGVVPYAFAQKCECDDVAPGSDFTCAEQAEFGQCVRAWMFKEGFCRKSCNRCDECVEQDEQGCPCTDMAPPWSEYTCEEQKEFGKCDSEWMLANDTISAGFCQTTCGRCNCGPAADADEEEPMEQPIEEPVSEDAVASMLDQGVEDEPEEGDE